MFGRKRIEELEKELYKLKHEMNIIKLELYGQRGMPLTLLSETFFGYYSKYNGDIINRLNKLQDIIREVTDHVYRTTEEDK